jgi:hypothetical protein
MNRSRGRDGEPRVRRMYDHGERAAGRVGLPLALGEGKGTVRGSASFPVVRGARDTYCADDYHRGTSGGG